MAKTYDPACYDLAEHFLQDEPCKKDPALYERHADDLAKTIQQAIEDWFLSPGDGLQTTLSLPSLSSTLSPEK